MNTNIINTVDWDLVIVGTIVVLLALFSFLGPYLLRRDHNKKCNGILYRSFTFNCISNVKCTKCDYDEDTLLPPAKGWCDVKYGEARKKNQKKSRNRKK
jgi:hypothetical protein